MEGRREGGRRKSGSEGLTITFSTYVGGGAPETKGNQDPASWQNKMLYGSLNDANHSIVRDLKICRAQKAATISN